MRLRKTFGLSLVLLVASSPAMAKRVEAGHHQSTPDIKAKPGKAATTGSKTAAKRPHAKGKAVASAAPQRRRQASERAERLPPPDEFIGPYQAAGNREVGTAAWYGGRHLGHRTASGEALDAVHATAAHRSLPLHSLVRVTNLRNGRSAIATITDRGPVSRSLLIDVSPKVAQELNMIGAGLTTVSVEPVIAAPNRPAEQAR